MFKSLAFLTKMDFLIPAEVYLEILGSARARAVIWASSSRSDEVTVSLERSLPLT